MVKESFAKFSQRIPVAMIAKSFCANIALLLKRKPIFFLSNWIQAKQTARFLLPLGRNSFSALSPWL